jgi:transposase InsO family protein
MIEAEKANYPIGLMCQALEVSRAGLYAWRERSRLCERAREDAKLLPEIRAIHAASRATYGSPRVHAALRRRGMRISRKRAARLMRSLGLRGKLRRRFRRTTDSNHELPIAPNVLDQHFSVESPDRVWAADITYIPLATGWGYLAVVLDLHSRAVVGWSLADHLRTELIEDALLAALGARVPEKDCIHHSDRGCQYASSSYRGLCESLGMKLSMSRRGNCYDNAVVESFFGTLKQELVHEARWATLEEARAALHDYIEVFYNRQRLHSALGYRTPAELQRAAVSAA